MIHLPFFIIVHLLSNDILVSDRYYQSLKCDVIFERHFFNFARAADGCITSPSLYETDYQQLFEILHYYYFFFFAALTSPRRSAIPPSC